VQIYFNERSKGYSDFFTDIFDHIYQGCHSFWAPLYII